MDENLLPASFLHKMQSLLADEFSDFLKSYSAPRTHGLRVNTLKLRVQQFKELVPFSLRPVPWAPEGFYYEEDERPGKHPYHAAGLYYIQEPSAMAVSICLDPQPGERILDLCAAPGGKTTHIGTRLRGQGLLVANEITPTRAKVLAENVERFGLTNTVVLNEHPRKLARAFPSYFDRILVDAPCSGEGMFRKDPESCSQWSLDNVQMCASRQMEILDSALKMLRPGGTLVYSTCTFAPEENEQVVEQLLDRFPDLDLVSPTINYHFAPGRPEWSKTGQRALQAALRLWPHQLAGEGHFIAVMHKSSSAPAEEFSCPAAQHVKALAKEALKIWEEFASAYLQDLNQQGTYMQYGENLYLSPGCLPDLTGIKVVRPGWHLGVIKKNRFEPGHGLALGIRSEQCLRTINLSGTDPQVLNYLRGETIQVPGEKGWNLLTVDNFPLGWGKHDGQILKNHYPKGLRWY